MVNHVVMFKFKPAVAPEERQTYIKELGSLKHKIAQVQGMEVGENVVSSPRAYDVVLIATFADREVLDTYARHPEHQLVMQRTREMCESVAVVDYLK